jgi:transcriptional regulator with XRE-family HTH domain
MTVLFHGGTTMSKTSEHFTKAMGGRIAQARKAQGLTQQQLADQLDLVQQTIAHYEAGRLRVPASLLAPMARYLGVSVDELLGEETSSHGKRGPAPKLLRQMERISQLPRATQKVVMNMLDGILAQANH